MQMIATIDVRMPKNDNTMASCDAFASLARIALITSHTVPHREQARTQAAIATMLIVVTTSILNYSYY